jgi:hypothetical protein
MTLTFKKMPTITIGCDPEIFIRDTKTQKFISGHDIVKGTKDHPEKWEKGAIQADGLAIEFNTIPAKNAHAFVTNVLDNLHYINGILKNHNHQYTVAIKPTAIFDKKYFDNLPDYAKELGCQPDFNAYTGMTNEKPKTDKPFRTGAGHVHIGWTGDKSKVSDVLENQHFETCSALVRQLDVSLFLPSLLFDDDTERRKLYGSPGSFRPREYGVEYRPLSNKWLRSGVLMTWIFNTTLKSVRDYFNGIDYTESITTDELEQGLKYAGTKKISSFVRQLHNEHPEIIDLPRGFH